MTLSQTIKVHTSMNPKGKLFKSSLRIETYTWDWDSHGLFDYENLPEKQIIYVNSSTKLVRDH